MSNRDVVICSFYTPDDYYGGHALELRAQLDSLGIAHELLQVEKVAGEDWADVTRKKIGFIRNVCQQHPDKMVFWIDVDCRISYLPDFIHNSTADLIGFQRSFGPPTQIGYQNRTRFWEPSFWGVNATEQGRKLIEDAYELEQRAVIKATDDYFLEEAWRANARNLTFQMIPTTLVIRERGLLEPGQREPFFSFGSSGNVADFKGKVVQHGTRRRKSLRSKLLAWVKGIEKRLPRNIRNPLRRIADSAGVTGALTSGKAKSLDPERGKYMGQLLGSAIGGNRDEYAKALASFENQYLPSYGERSTIEAAEAFLEYSDRGGSATVPLMWWAKPFPGNFGDWLSPLIVSRLTDSNIRVFSPTGVDRKKHMVSLGSIGRFIRSNSVVVGTGISTEDLELNTRADYVSVRGPLTAKVLRESGGKAITAFGDPGLALSELMPMTRGATNGKTALVRHFSHSAIPIQLSPHTDELSVMMSRGKDIEAFVATLNQYDRVITSAMHVMIICQSYGIPCGLITFAGYEENVHGSGIKYADYALGAGVDVMNPVPVALDLREQNIDNLVRDIRVSQEKKLEVIGHLQAALERFSQ